MADPSSGSTPANTPADVPLPSLKQLRASWNALVSSRVAHADMVYVVVKQHLDAILAPENSHPDLHSLCDAVGPFDASALVDASGEMHPEDREPIESTVIAQVAFDELSRHFGVRGTPISRVMLQHEDGRVAVERFPPVFVIHTLAQGHSTRYAHHSDRHASAPSRNTVRVSQTHTFADLVHAVRSALYKSRPPVVRLWLVASDGAGPLGASITPEALVYLNARKKLVSPELMGRTLASEGITSARHHVVAEAAEGSGQWPLNTYLASVDARQLDEDALFAAGGNLGLTNLGNTCYMNSALQCLVHIPELNNYFFLDLWQNELNKLNPLGCHGEIAAAFSSLLHKLFDVSSGSQQAVTPRDFKLTVGRFSSMFHGYQQQDSQEFMSWLLDTLHEDLNRIQKKPYLEKPELRDDEMDSADALRRVADTCWRQHKMRNDSVIVDLFTGLYQLTLVCPACSKKSVTLDPFNNLTLPLPQSLKWYHTFTVVDTRPTATRALFRLEVELAKTATLDDLITYLARVLAAETRHLFLFEIFRSFFYKSLHDNSLNKFLPMSDLISSADTVCVYVVPHDPATDIIVPVVNVVRDEDVSYHVSDAFAFPLFVVLDRRADACSYNAIRAKIERAVVVLTRLEHLNASGPCAVPNEPDSLENKASAGAEAHSASAGLSTPLTSLGFQIRVFEDDGRARLSASRFKPSVRACTEPAPLLEVVHVPLTRPSFGTLPLLELKVARALPVVSEDENSDVVIVGEDDFATAEKGALNVAPALNAVYSRSVPIFCGSSSSESSGSSGDSSYSDSENSWHKVEPVFGAEKSPTTVSDVEACAANGTAAVGTVAHGTVINEHAPNGTPIVTPRLCLVVDWAPAVFNTLFSEENRTWEDIEQMANPEVEQSKRKQMLREKSSVSLIECLRNFSSPEVLGEQDLWYCPRCKDHKRATKTIQIWSTGDILTIHLKRFHTSRSFSDKLNMLVDFPIEGLDVSEFVATHDSDGTLYDLMAVDNHYGGLGGGHYTASVLNFRDGRWYYFDDSRVTRIEDPRLTVTSAAYVLFYRKRSLREYLGGKNTEALLAAGRRSLDARLSRGRDQIASVRDEVDTFGRQQTYAVAASDDEQLNLSDSCGNLNFKSLDVDDIYSDAMNASDADSADAGDTEHRTGSKNQRSPATVQNSGFGFDNPRKQRLISKDWDEPRSVNINLGLSSSASNLASPEVSFDEDALMKG